MKPQKTYKSLLILTLVLVLLSGSSVAILSCYYQTPASFVVKEILRKSVLFSIAAAVQIYDPAPVVSPVFEPSPADSLDKFGELVRIEDFFEQRSPGNLKLTAVKNEKHIISQFDFNYQPFDAPDLHRLRTENGLDSLVAACESEFQAMVFLRNWFRQQYRRQDYQPMMENFNAVTVLKNNIKNPENKPYTPEFYRPCHFAPLFYSQLLLSVGFQPRIVTISFEKYYEGHGMVEVWSNQFNKWILMDPDLNLHYIKNGVPQNTLELHEARYLENPGIEIIYPPNLYSNDESEADEKNPLKQELTVENMIQYHSYIRINDLRNDWMTNFYFRGHPQRSDFAQVEWFDENIENAFSLNPKTSNRDDYYWSLNRTEIKTPLDSNPTEKIKLIFETFTPNFDYFQIIINDSLSTHSKSPVFDWKLETGKNKLRVTSVNQFGVAGVPGYLEIDRN